MVKNNINKVKQIQDFFPPFIIVLIFLLHVPTASNENWWTTYCTDDDFENIDHSGKLMLLFSILDECSICGDKLLVFSQSLSTLDLIEKFLAMITENTKNPNPLAQLSGFKGEWKKGIQYYRLDGSTSADKREMDCKNFNDGQNVQARFDMAYGILFDILFLLKVIEINQLTFN